MSDDVRFNKFKNKLITLRDGEQFCKKCKGMGAVPYKNPKKISFLATKFLTCSVCFGDGKLDWVEQATGKPKTTMGGECDCAPSN